MNRDETQKFITQFPIYQYAFQKPDDSFFSSKVVKGCRNCKNYRTSWSCPPAIVSFEKCRRECMSYDDIFVFSSICDLRTDTDGTLKKKLVKEHEKITNLAGEYLKSLGNEVYILTSSRCSICDKCTFPRKACEHPNRMHPCIESHGVKMNDLLAKCDMDCFFEEGYSLLFSLIFYKSTDKQNGE